MGLGAIEARWWVDQWAAGWRVGCIIYAAYGTLQGAVSDNYSLRKIHIAYASIFLVRQFVSYRDKQKNV